MFGTAGNLARIPVLQNKEGPERKPEYQDPRAAGTERTPIINIRVKIVSRMFGTAGNLAWIPVLQCFVYSNISSG
jgi:hypothetical protein